MKYFIALLIIITAASCRSRKANDFNNFLDSAERKAYRILVADSIEIRRLDALVDKRPQIALSLAKEQAAGLNKLIDTIGQFNIDGIKDAAPLKKNAIDYYKALLRLKDMDMQEAEAIAITIHNDTAKVKKPEVDMLAFTRKRVDIHRAIGDADNARYNSQLRFRKVNGIK